MRIQTLAVGFMLLSGSTVGAQTTRATPEACAALMQLQVPGVALTVTRSEWLAAGAPIPGGRGGAPVASNLPAYCRLDGAIDRRTGAAGVAYAIGFALALPENWNGRFLFQGGGGLNGSVQPPLGGSAAGGESGLARGFAVVSTDTGHQGRVDSTAASGRTSRRASTSRMPRSVAWRTSPNASSRSTTASRRIVRTSLGVPPAGARRC